MGVATRNQHQAVTQARCTGGWNATERKEESANCTQGTRPCPSTILTICFSVYLFELRRFTASMCPKSMS